MSVVPIAFDISSLTPNTTYTFAVTPINARGISGIPSSFSINTPAVLYNTAVQNYNYQSVTLSISGAYKYVNINRNGVNIQTNYQGTLFFDSSGIQGLIPDMSYSYIITPYNRANVPSSLFKTVKVNTLPVVYNVDYTSDISSITLSISGIYSYISIFENINQYDIIVPHHDILHIPHYDLSYIPHYDISYIPHYDDSGNIVYDGSGNIVYDISYILLLDNSGNIVYDPSYILLYDNSGNVVYDPSMILLYDNSGNVVYDPSMILL